MSDWKEEALKAMAAKWAEEEKAWRRDNVGKVRLYLVNAEDDPPTFTEEGQVDLRVVMAAIRASKIEAKTPFLTVDSVDAVGGYTGEIALLISAVSPILTRILGAWLQAKAGRKVKLKDGDIEVEAGTVKEVGELLNMAAAQRAKRQQNGDS